MINKCAIFCCFLLFVSCVKDKPNPDNHDLPDATHQGVLMTNEGTYGSNNGDISFLDLETNVISNNLFQLANSQALGDVVQSAIRIGQQYYVAVNNSNKIVVLDAYSYKSVASILGIKSPRYITQVSAQKAYVSSLYFPFVYVIDISTNTLLKTISVDFSNTEKMLVKDGYCYVTNWDTASNLLYKINITNDSIESKIQLPGRASHEIVEDKNGMLWILSGNKYKNKSSFLVQYNPVTYQIHQSFPFASDEDPFRLIINATLDTLYYINVNYNGASTNNGLYKFGISESSLPSNPFIHANSNSYFWAVGIDKNSKHIFLSDPKGFTQQSTIYEYLSNGTLLRQYAVGIGANAFLFNY